jgi:aromatic ring-opening dioxygenase catalytic subunit (LigB family)
MLHRSLDFASIGIIFAITLSSALFFSYYGFDLSVFRSGLAVFSKTLHKSTSLATADLNPVNMSSSTSWHQALETLPSTPDKIPAFFFAHGSPMLAFPPTGETAGMMAHHGPKGPLAQFLAAFGPILLKKYKPKAIVVFSAHWESDDVRLVSDYDENPLLMDYYGFPQSLYELKFKSRGDAKLSQRVVELYEEAGQNVRKLLPKEPRGQDGRGFEGTGLDHGVFVPFRIMFGEEFTDIPIVQVSIDGSLDPEKNWQVGKAVAKLREEGVLVLSGGLTAHNLKDRTSFSPDTAREVHKEFDRAVHEALNIEQVREASQWSFLILISTAA